MESGLQNGTFVYKMGFLVTKGESYLQNGNLELQMGISDCNSSLLGPFFFIIHHLVNGDCQNVYSMIK
jgi:hypothetical protein